MPILCIGNDYRVIEVKFYEGQAEKPFAISNIHIEQLPDTFEINTNMHLGDVNWTIIDANPLGKSDFRKSGKLKLYMIKTELSQIDPREILYSLPTINDTLANIEHADSLENVAVFHEDNWRQFEFIETKFKNDISKELVDINTIYNNHKEGIGFKQIHIRKRIPNPITQAALTIKNLTSAFDIAKKYDGVAFESTAGTIVNGFALQTQSGFIIWGQSDITGKIIVLNISQTEKSNLIEIAKRVDAFSNKYNLYIVNWPKLFWSGFEKLRFIKFDKF